MTGIEIHSDAATYKTDFMAEMTVYHHSAGFKPLFMAEIGKSAELPHIMWYFIRKDNPLAITHCEPHNSFLLPNQVSYSSN